MVYTAKITSKGQVTIPSKIRKQLGSKIVQFEVRDNEIIMHPVGSVGGALSTYAGKYTSLSTVRDESWRKGIRRHV